MEKCRTRLRAPFLFAVVFAAILSLEMQARAIPASNEKIIHHSLFYIRYSTFVILHSLFYIRSSSLLSTTQVVSGAERPTQSSRFASAGALLKHNLRKRPANRIQSGKASRRTSCL